MGKILVIKGADFSRVAVGKVTPGEVTPVIPIITVDTENNTATLTTGKTGLDIYYTLDGTTPTTSSTRYTTAINNVSGKTIKAISYNGETSSSIPKITATFDGQTNALTLACSVGGATIRYTDNGSTPTTSSTAYSSAITVVSGKTYKVIAFNGSSAVSDEVSIQITA